MTNGTKGTYVARLARADKIGATHYLGSYLGFFDRFDRGANLADLGPNERTFKTASTALRSAIAAVDRIGSSAADDDEIVVCRFLGTGKDGRTIPVPAGRFRVSMVRTFRGEALTGLRPAHEKQSVDARRERRILQIVAGDSARWEAFRSGYRITRDLSR